MWEECNGLDDDLDGVTDEDPCPATYRCAVPSTCTCAPTYTRCGGSCAILRDSQVHCGACGRSCGASLRCFGGECHCDGALLRCGEVCVNAQSDPQHCGACGRTCRALETCVEGQCRCEPPFLECEGRCLDPRSDRANCGACGRVCGDWAECLNGICVCFNPNVVVEGRCVPRGTVGLCDTSGRCPDNQSCVDGRCRCTYTCQNQCVDPMTDFSNCGLCGRGCAIGMNCVAGHCECPGGLRPCAEGCVDFQRDRMHCGGCSRACRTHETCEAGRCVCPPSHRACDHGCVGARLNCGACGVACAWSSACVADACRQRVGTPAAGERVGSRRPTLRWPGGPGTADVCADAACTRVLESIGPGPLGAATVTRSLAPGRYFWRVRGVGAPGTTSSSIPFRVDRRDVPRLGLLPPAPDVNGDGLDDVVVASSSVAVFLGATPALSTTPTIVHAWPSSRVLRHLSLPGDTNSDAQGDLFVGFAEGHSTLLWGARGPSWAPLPVEPSFAPIADANDDGLTDGFVFAPEAVSARYGDSDGSTGSVVRLLPRPLSLGSVTAVGDVDGDGHRDVAIVDASEGRLVVFLGSATGLDRSISSRLPSPSTTPPRVSAAGDVNGDGFADLLVALDLGALAVYFGASHTLTLHRYFPPEASLRTVGAAGDIDGDGFGDVASVDAAGGALHVLRGGSAGLAATPAVLRDARWSSVDTLGLPRDVDGDGFDDLVLGDAGRGTVYVLHGDAARPLTRVEVLPVTPAPSTPFLVL